MTGGSAPANTGARPAGNKRIEKRRLLLGEGVDEQFFFEAMLKHLAKDDTQVLSYGGKPKLPKFLDFLRTDPAWPDVESLLITRDADFPRDAAAEPAALSAWRSVTDTLRSLHLPVPRVHAEMTGAGDVETGILRVGVFILPDGLSDGMLEDLCLAAVGEDPVTSCVDAYFRCIEEKGATIERHFRPKARAHAYLASRPNPDRRVGEAALAGYWPWEAAALAPLLDFVRRG